MSTNPHRNKKKTWVAIDKFLHPPYRQIWQLKSLRDPFRGGGHTSVSVLSRSSTRFSQWISEKSPLLLPAGVKGKGTIWNMPGSSALNKVLPPRETILPEPNCWGFIRAYLTWGQGNTQPQAPLAILSYYWEVAVTLTIQEHRLTKSLRPNHRTDQHFPSPYQSITKGLITTVPFNKYIMPTFQQKLSSHTKKQKHSLESLNNIRTRVRYSKSVRIIRPRILITKIISAKCFHRKSRQHIRSDG